jgi:hypothetical protein
MRDDFDQLLFSSVDLHALRGTFATLAIDGNANPRAVQSILGHATLDMTMRVYTKATDKAKRAAISALPFATASAPAHVVSIDKRQVMSQDSHSCSKSEASKVG